MRNKGEINWSALIILLMITISFIFVTLWYVKDQSSLYNRECPKLGMGVDENNNRCIEIIDEKIVNYYSLSKVGEKYYLRRVG